MTLAVPRKNSSKFKQGKYVPENPHKYVGDVNKIRYMSSYELETHQFFDRNTSVLRWGSEVVVIPYIKPTDGKIHKYYVDYWVEYVDRDGNIRVQLVEVKPRSQTRAPSKNSKHALYEQVQHEINKAKWTAAQAFAHARGWEFKIITERSIFK